MRKPNIYKKVGEYDVPNTNYFIAIEVEDNRFRVFSNTKDRPNLDRWEDGTVRLDRSKPFGDNNLSLKLILDLGFKKDE